MASAASTGSRMARRSSWTRSRRSRPPSRSDSRRRISRRSRRSARGCMSPCTGGEGSPRLHFSVIYAKPFFDLQLQFAHKVAALSGLPLARVLFEYTNLYVRFGLGRDFDPAHPIWREYLSGLKDTNDSREWTYRF